MADMYIVGAVPQEYDNVFLAQELQKIQTAMAELETPVIILVPTYVVPSRTTEGMVVNADGLHWNPGVGAGLYEFRGSTWNKL